MLHPFPSALVLLCLACWAALAAANLVEPEHHGWTKRSIGKDTDQVKVYMSLPLNHSHVDREIAAVSHPCSKRYGGFLSYNETKKFMDISPHAEKKVQDWLKAQGITKRASNGLIDLDLSVRDASRLFNATYHEYEHEDGRRSLHAKRHRIPDELLGHAEVFGPSIGMASKRSTIRSTVTPLMRRDDDPEGTDDCDAPVYPSCMRKIYGTESYEVQVPEKNGIGVAGFLGQVPNRDALHAFAESYRPEAHDAEFKISYVSRGSNKSLATKTQEHGGEADLDLQIVTTQAWPVPVTYYYDGGTPPTQSGDRAHVHNEPYLSLFQYLLDLPDAALPSVLTISYSDPEETVPKSYAKRVCHYAAMLGLRGVTIIAGSGDEGVGPASENKCKKDGSKRFVPWFPASCPYITTVGGTASPPDETVATKSNAGYVTGSGFSEYFAQPHWQKDVVNSYLEDEVPQEYKSYINTQGRAYPDVSAVSAYVAAQFKGAPRQFSGTSASAPIFASVIALLNDARIAANKSRLGFLNPLLYQHLGPTPGTFNDITTGSNSGCGTDGFKAVKGWDAVSGFGSPNFTALHDALLHTSPSCGV